MTDQYHYHLESLRRAYQAGERPKYLFFWGHKEAEGPASKACLSQWYPSAFQAEGAQYRWAEQYMMAQKALLFQDQETAWRIMEAGHPGECKKLGRKVRNFDGAVWDRHKSAVVIQGNYEKFSQNPELGQFLLATGRRVLAEASPYDRIWGIGMAADSADIENPLCWRGQNLLGFALMEVRDRLAREAGAL